MKQILTLKRLMGRKENTNVLIAGKSWKLLVSGHTTHYLLFLGYTRMRGRLSKVHDRGRMGCEQLTGLFCFNIFGYLFQL